MKVPRAAACASFLCLLSLANGPATAQTETWTFLRDGDTVRFFTDYGSFPKVEPTHDPWEVESYDSVWTDTLEDGFAELNIRRNHIFRVVTEDGKEGVAQDYVYYIGDRRGDHHITMGCYFNFWDSKGEDWGNSQSPCRAHPASDHEYLQPSEPGEHWPIEIRDGGSDLGQLLSRKPGWAQGTTALASRPAPGAVSLLRSGMRAVRVPAGMTGLRAYDLAGRAVFRADRLEAGKVVELPGSLPEGVVRLRWTP